MKLAELLNLHEAKRTKEDIEADIKELDKKIVQHGKDGTRASIIRDLENKLRRLRTELKTFED